MSERPRKAEKKREGAPSKKSKRLITLEGETLDEKSEEIPKKKRGRPPGSKNKVKEPVIPKLTFRERAELAAESTLDELPELEFCRICEFPLDDPIKALKRKVRCPECKNIIHEPCLLKAGCNCDSI